MWPDLEQVGEWLTAKGLRAVEQAPALGLYREALHDKLVNAGAPWESNDLTDLFYLTCAAGYVDYLACERETAAVLRQGSRRLKRLLPVHSTLQGLAADLSFIRGPSATGQ